MGNKRSFSMSPVDDGQKQVYRDADGFLRNERGLKSMAHLAVLIAMSLSIAVALSGIVLIFTGTVEGVQLVLSAVGLAAAGSGLEGWQTHTEGKNQRTNG
jgi:hypothetical protein